jgi:hypothetical protein
MMDRRSESGGASTLAAADPFGISIQGAAAVVGAICTATDRRSVTIGSLGCWRRYHCLS